MPSTDIPDLSILLSSAKRGDRDAFQQLAEPYRLELRLHCYRMLGSVHDAEDLVPETFLRAWRGLNGFEGRASFRGWLYRIATNACLHALTNRANARRALPASAAGGAVASRRAGLDGHRDCGVAGRLGSVSQQRPATRPRHACERIPDRSAQHQPGA